LKLKEITKNKKGLDGVSSAGFAELYFGFDVAVTLGALNCVFDLGKDIFGFAEFFPEDLVVE